MHKIHDLSLELFPVARLVSLHTICVTIFFKSLLEYVVFTNFMLIWV